MSKTVKLTLDSFRKLKEEYHACIDTEYTRHTDRISIKNTCPLIKEGDKIIVSEITDFSDSTRTIIYEYNVSKNDDYSVLLNLVDFEKTEKMKKNA